MSGDRPDLEVPPEALALISQGIDKAHGELKDLGMTGEASMGRGYSDLALSGLELGHEGLTAEFKTFCERWEWGVRALMIRGNGFASAVGLSAGAIHEQEQYIKGTFKIAVYGVNGNPHLTEEKVKQKSWDEISTQSPYDGADWSRESFSKAQDDVERRHRRKGRPRRNRCRPLFSRPATEESSALAEIRLQLRGTGQHRSPARGQPTVPVVQCGPQRFQSAGRPDLGDQRGDLLQQVAAPPELVGQPGVPYVGLVVDAVPGSRVAVRAHQPGAFPFAQRRGPDSQLVCQRPDERAAGPGHRGRLGRLGRLQVAEGVLHGLEGPSVVEELGVALVDEAERPIDRALVHGPHDRRRCPVAVAGHEGKERAQRPRVQRGVGAVAVGGATGGRKDAGLLVVPDRLRGQTVPARQINRPEPITALKVSPHGADDIARKFQPKVQRYR